jgi:hypothetical protein
MREAKHCTCVLTEEEMETAHQNGIDIICIVGVQRCPFERRISVSRSTPSSRLLGKLKFDSPMHSFQELKKKPKEGYESRRFGGLVERQGWTTTFFGLSTTLEPPAGKRVRSCYLMLTFEIGTFSTRVRIPKNQTSALQPACSGWPGGSRKIEWSNRTSDLRLMQLLKHCFHTFWQQ